MVLNFAGAHAGARSIFLPLPADGDLFNVETLVARAHRRVRNANGERIASP
jgi:hypothetical protein